MLFPEHTHTHTANASKGVSFRYTHTPKEHKTLPSKFSEYKYPNLIMHTSAIHSTGSKNNAL